MPRREFIVRHETTLHTQLKQWYATPGSVVEAVVDGYIIDIIDDGQLIEIQTSGFSALKGKLRQLLPKYPIRVVYPVAQEKYIRRVSRNGETIQRRKSPKRGSLQELFRELIRFPELTLSPNFSLEVAMLIEEDIWKDDQRGSWRRKYWSVADRQLLEMVSQHRFNSVHDYLGLLPAELPVHFTANDLAEASKMQVALVRKMLYCMRAMMVIESIGKRGRSNLYSLKR